MQAFIFIHTGIRLTNKDLFLLNSLFYNEHPPQDKNN